MAEAPLQRLKRLVSESEAGRKDWRSMLGTKKEFKKHMAKKMKKGCK